MGKPEKLSKRQQTILNFLAKYVEDHKRPPTIREIGEASSISSTSVVSYNLDKLERMELIVRDPEVSRGLSLTNKARELVGMAVETVQNLLRIPVLGQIVAGEPIEVGNDSFSTFGDDVFVEVATSMLPKNPKDLFALRVSGDSMIDAMVNDGDIVVMKRQELARDGEMVAVWLDSSDTTTLKYFFHEGDRIRLQPANPTMKPIYAEPEDVRIQGRVVIVFRQTV